jgi:hypothetical protein
MGIRTPLLNSQFSSSTRLHINTVAKKGLEPLTNTFKGYHVTLHYLAKLKSGVTWYRTKIAGTSSQYIDLYVITPNKRSKNYATYKLSRRKRRNRTSPHPSKGRMQKPLQHISVKIKKPCYF